MGEKEELELTHESYGSVSFSRRQGNPGRLFGSALHDHGSYITLSISRARLIRGDLYDRHFSGLRGNLVEVDMSAAQFAELLTTMNVGSGVPCTISCVEDKRMERPPEIPHETENVRTNFKEKISELVKTIETDLKEVSVLFQEKKTLSRTDRETALGKFSRILTQLRSNAPFVLEMFQEATDKVVTASKAEIDAFITTNVVQAGLKNLLQPASDDKPPVPQLPEKT